MKWIIRATFVNEFTQKNQKEISMKEDITKMK